MAPGKLAGQGLATAPVLDYVTARRNKESKTYCIAKGRASPHGRQTDPAGHPQAPAGCGGANPPRLSGGAQRAGRRVGRRRPGGAEPRVGSGCDPDLRHRNVHARRHRTAAGSAEDRGDVLGRLRPHRRRRGPGPRPRRHQHAGRPDRCHGRHHDAVPAGCGAPGAERGTHPARGTLGSLGRDGHAGPRGHRQAAGNLWHGTDRTRRGPTRPGLRHGDSLQQPKPPAAGA